MKALLLNGLEKGDGEPNKVQDICKAKLTDAGWDVETVRLYDKNIASCTGCFGCWVKTPGECVIRDDAPDITRILVKSDLVIYLAPLTYGGYSPLLKRIIDRSICINLPFFGKINGEVHHKKRYDSYPNSIYLGILEEPDMEDERIFHSLSDRMAINFNAPEHATGITYEGQRKGEIEVEVERLFKSVGALK